MEIMFTVAGIKCALESGLMFCWALCLALSVSVKPLNIKHICPHNAGFSVGKRGH